MCAGLLQEKVGGRGNMIYKFFLTMVFVLQTPMTFGIIPHFRYIVVNVSPTLKKRSNNACFHGLEIQHEIERETRTKMYNSDTKNGM